MSVLRKVAPKTFLWRYPLRTGALSAAVILLCVTLICGIALAVQVLLMKSCTTCAGYAFRNAYSFSVSSVIYCVLMFIMHALLIWGIRQKKTTFLLAWVVITSMWLTQTFFLLIILLCIHSTKVNLIACILSFKFGMIAILILIYLVLVVLGLWFELKDAQKAQSMAFQHN